MDLELGRAFFSSTLEPRVYLTTSARNLRCGDLCLITANVEGMGSLMGPFHSTSERTSERTKRGKHCIKMESVPGKADIQVKPKISKLKPHFPLEKKEKT